MRKFTLFLSLFFAMAITAFAQEPVVSLTSEQIGTTYPYTLSDDDAAKVFALTDLTVAVKVTTPSSMSGRKALFATSDPTQVANTSAKGMDSYYVGYGTSNANTGYLASCVAGDRFTAGSIATNSEVVLVYVISPSVSTNTFRLYVDGVQVRAWENAHTDGFMSAYEIATPKMVKEDHNNAKIYIGGGMLSGGAFETFDGTIEAVKVFDGALTADEVANVFAEEEAAERAEALAAFNEAYANAQEILAEAAYSASKTEVVLQTSDADSANYLWCNVPDPEEGDIAYLVNGNNDNSNEFFHSSWHSSVVADMHYLEVDLGENASLKDFVIAYHTRTGAANDYPDAIQVMVSDEKDANFVEVANFTDGLPQSSGTSWESSLVSLDETYRYIRFNITAERTYWHLAEFDILETVVSISDKYSTVVTAVAALDAAYKDAANYETFNAAALNAATAAITEALEAVEAALPEPVAPLTVVSVTPSESVESLSEIVIEFSDEISGEFDIMGMTQIYLGSRSNGCSFAVEGTKLTITPFYAITTAGEYGLYIPSGLITRVADNSAVTMDGTTVVFTVEEAAAPVLAQTAVFDFVVNEWGIPTMEESNYSGVKSATVLSDGVNTIEIDPTANGGNFYYDDCLRIAKTGTTITLPAFGFDVEKIEVIGHSKASSYANADMNVYVDGTAVSTACVGSTGTNVFEIAESAQAAGNVYELTIGSNGGNYSSIIYISYIKVYPKVGVEAPIFDVESGVYTQAFTVNVSSPTVELEGVTDVIYYYTINGGMPTSEDDETYGAIEIAETCTVQVVVEFTYNGATYTSDAASAEYIISEAVTYNRATAVEEGDYFLAADGHLAAPYGNNVMPAVETIIDGDQLTDAVYFAVTLEKAAEGEYYNGAYNIKDVNGNYIYTSGMYGTSGPKLYSNGSYVPSTPWIIEINEETGVATVTCDGIYLVYDSDKKVFTVSAQLTENVQLPIFYGTKETGIDEVKGENGEVKALYDLNGRKLDKVAAPGIYIVDGNKVLVK